MKPNFFIAIAGMLALTGCGSLSHRAIAPRPVPSVQPLRQGIVRARSQAREASGSAARAREGISAASDIANQIRAQKIGAQTGLVKKLQTLLVQAARDADSARAQAEASAAESQASDAKAGALQTQIDLQAGDLDKARQTIADQQDEMIKVQKHDAATAASNRRLIFRIMIYRISVAVFVAWIASKFVPALLPQFKLYAALGAGAVTLGALCWFL
jgi:hypothetical protein